MAVMLDGGRGLRVQFGQQQQQVEESGSFGPRQLLSVVRRRWLVIGGGALIVTVLGIVYVLQLTPRYTATAEVLLDTRKKNLLTSEAVVSDLSLDRASLATEVALIKSVAVASRASKKLGLAKSVAQSTLSGSEVSARQTADKQTADDRAAELSRLEAAERAAVSRIKSGLQVRREGPTYIIQISYTDFAPETAASVANAVAEAYLVEQLEARYTAARRAATWLSERVAEVRRELDAAEQAVAQHRLKYKLGEAAKGTLVEQQIADINGKLVAARAETVEKRTKYDYAKRVLEGGGKIESVEEVTKSAVITSLRQQEAEVRRRLADLSSTYGPKHPKIVNARAELSDLERQIKNEMSRIVATLKSDYEVARKSEQSLETSLQQLTDGDRSNAAIRKLRQLEREAAATRTLYESLLVRSKQAQQEAALPSTESRIITPAVKPSAPSFPNKKRILILVLIGGLAVGFCGAFLLDYAENGFMTMEQAEHTLALPVLAMLPSLTKGDLSRNEDRTSVPHYLAQNPLSRFGEGIRSVRVNTEMSNIDDPPRLVLVTSASEAEGKSTIAICYAVSAAMAGKRTLLIDCDLRRATTTKHFKFEGEIGLTDVVSGQADKEQAFRSGGLNNLTVVAAGTPSKHPPDLIASKRMRDFLAEIREAYDAVIIDSPPLSQVVDSSLLARLVDAAVFVVRWRKTPREVAQRAVAAIADDRTKISGLVLNFVESRTTSSYSAYYAHTNKEYGGYYS